MGRYSHKTVIDIETGAILSAEYFEYGGPVEFCKGGSSQQEMDRANQLQDQQLQMLQNQLNMANPSLNSIIQNGGMTPEQEAAMKSIALNSLPQTYNNAVGQINNALVARGVTGGNMAGGGGIAKGFESLFQQEGKQQSDLLSQIQVDKSQGLNQALSMALGLAPTFNQGATSALQSGVTAAGNVDAAKTGFWGSLMGAIAAPFSISKSI